MKFLLFFIATIAGLALVGARSAEAEVFVFFRNLKLADRGEDVRQLQLFLNTIPETKLARSGAGSPGLETSFFGPLTHRAVIKFQEKFTEEILVPVGVSSGTGFVGLYTRSKLNTLLALETTTPSPTPAVSVPVPLPLSPTSPILQTGATRMLSEEEARARGFVDVYRGDAELQTIRSKLDAEVQKFITTNVRPTINLQELAQNVNVLISGLSDHAALPGTRITIGGFGFTPSENSIYLSTEYELAYLASSLGTNISFIVPNIPPGRYDLAVANSKGVSNSTFFIVKKVSAPTISLTAVEPVSIHYGDEITLRGSGFTNTNNEIRTNFGTFSNLGSDGTTITFTFAPEMLRQVVEAPGVKPPPVTLPFFVVNANGYTKEPLLAELRFQ